MISMLIDLALLILVTFILVFAYFKFIAYKYWINKKIPQLEPSFPFGNLEPSHKKTKSMGEDVADSYRAMRAKGWNYGGIYMLARPVLMTADLDILKLIMTKDFDHFMSRGLYVNEKDEPIGAHLVAIGGAKWRNLRTKLTPTFTSGKMRMMFQTLADVGVGLEKFFDEAAENREPVDIKNTSACFSTDIIGSVAFGLKLNTLQEPNSDFRVYSKKIFHRTILQAFKSLVYNSFPNIGRLLHLRAFPTDASDFFFDVVNKTVKYREDNNVERKDILQLLIDLKNNQESVRNLGDGKTLTMDEVVAQSFVFFLAGFDTSSTTMTFVLYELGRNPHIQDKVRKEIHEVLQKHNNQVTYDSMKELTYMQQVIDETMRMYPPVPFVARECNEEYQIPGTDEVLDVGTRILISILGIHYDEEYYKNPTVFDPERFKESEKQQRNPYAHIPFGEGPRTCIGKRFGIMQSKVGLTSILNTHRITLNSQTEVPLKLAINKMFPSPAKPVMLNIEKLKP